MTQVVVLTMNWDASAAIESIILVDGDGKSVSGTIHPPDTFQVADGVKALTIMTRSMSPNWWGATVTLTVEQGGALKLRDRGDAISVDIDNTNLPSVKVVLRLSRLRVVTGEIVDELKKPTRRVPPRITPPAGSDPRLARFIIGTNRDRLLAVASFEGGTVGDLFPGVMGDLEDVAFHSSPIQGRELKLPPIDSLVTIGAPPVVTAKNVLQFQRQSVAPNNDTFVVEVAGEMVVDPDIGEKAGVVPQIIAVSWPKDVPRKEPAPMFVYYRHGPAQENVFGYGKFSTPYAYPYTFDYAYFGLLTTLWYRLPPDWWPYDQGLPYQIEAAGRKVVTVVACPTAYPPKRPKKKGETEARAKQQPQAGEWTSPEFMQSILLEIQALALAKESPPTEAVKPPTSLGRVAIGAFSSGHWHLNSLLKQEAHSFLTNTVKECYLFDPDNKVFDDGALGTHLLAWAANVPSNEAIIRLYNHRPMPQQRFLLNPIVEESPRFTDTAGGHRTIAVSQAKDWDRSLAALRGEASPRGWSWPDEHFATAAFMLKHAMGHSGF
jgi:hypothetical protein